MQVAENAVYHLLTTVPVHADEHKLLETPCCAALADNSAAAVYAFIQCLSPILWWAAGAKTKLAAAADGTVS